VRPDLLYDLETVDTAELEAAEHLLDNYAEIYAEAEAKGGTLEQKA